MSKSVRAIKLLSLPAVLLAVLSLAAPTASAGGEEIYAKLLKEKAGAVVSVKLVLSIKGRGGQRDVPMSGSGIVVDPSGLIMMPAEAFDPMAGMRRFMRRRGGGAPPSAPVTPVSIRVTFPGDTKEYDAVLGAKDSKLGLGFILIKDLAGKKIEAVQVAGDVAPKIGQTLYGVSRLGQGFDHAPVCNRVRISGEVSKPRAMWTVQGGGQHLAEPLYDANGAVMGIMVQQQGVGEDAETRPFLLPLKVANPTVSGALKKAKAELERVLEEEEEAAAEAADAAEEDGEKKDSDAKETDGDKKADGDKKDGDGN